jgi:hypothetical protein
MAINTKTPEKGAAEPNLGGKPSEGTIATLVGSLRHAEPKPQG